MLILEKKKRSERIRKNTKICGVCNKIFYSKNQSALYCSKKCQNISSSDFNVIFSNSSGTGSSALYWVRCSRCGKMEKKANWYTKKKSDDGLWKCSYCRDIERIKRCPVCGKIFKKTGRKFCSARCSNVNVYVPVTIKKERKRIDAKIRGEKDRKILSDAYIKKLLTERNNLLSLKTEDITPEIIESKREILIMQRTIKKIKGVKNGIT